MRELTKREVVAMWLWSEEYARLGIGAIEFYRRIDSSRKRLVDDFLRQIKEAPA